MAPKKINIPVPDGVRKNWASSDPRNLINHHGYNKANITHVSNLNDHGFNHLNTPVPVPGDHDTVFPQDPPTFNTVDEERKYVDLLEQKLEAARDFILKETELGLDPSRCMDKDPTAILLAKPPMVLNFYTQELIRDIIAQRPRLVELSDIQEANQQEVQELVPRFLRVWKELQAVIAILVSGKSEEVKVERARILMTRVLGENPVVE